MLLISGLSCSGKSTLARNLADRLGGEMIRMDDYYFESDPASFETTNFDDPKMINFELLVHHVVELKGGRAVDSPIYDFVKCRYIAHRKVVPPPFLIVEGQYTSLNEALLEQSSLGIFLEVEDEECIRRRLQRDCQELGRSQEESLARFGNRVLPAFNLHREALKRNSDLHLVSNTQEAWLQAVIQRIGT